MDHSVIQYDRKALYCVETCLWACFRLAHPVLSSLSATLRRKNPPRIAADGFSTGSPQLDRSLLITDLENSESQWVFRFHRTAICRKATTQAFNEGSRQSLMRNRASWMRNRASRIDGSTSRISSFFLEMQVGRGNPKH